MRSTIKVLAWDKDKGDFQTTIVIDHIVRWISIYMLEPSQYGQIAEHDLENFLREEAEGKAFGTGVLLSNGEHLVIKMSVEDFEQLYKEAE